MTINRSAEHHRERLIEALRDEIGALIEGELSDPRIGLCYVTELILMPGGKSVRVLINVDGDDDEAKETMEGLTAAKVYIRTLVRDRLGKRHVPDISFHLDRSQQLEGRINELLHRVEKRKRKKKSV